MAPTTATAQRSALSKGKGSGRSRKTLLSVEIDRSSYDRTDPFFAFNALRKLLGALSTRVGGCQYRMSPEEHRLSMHLLTIVEPFIGLSPGRRTLTRQPTEILDAIIFNIDSKSDLLALGLTCQRLYGVVFPRHYDYRLIRCKVSSIRVWNHLVVHRSLARNVRRLVILDERSPEREIVPASIMASDTDLESTDDELGMHAKQERYLTAALTRMTAVQSLMWSCNHSPISIDNVWQAIMKSQSLKEVEIYDNLVFTSYRHNEDGLESPPSHPTHVLPELKAVALASTKHAYGSTKIPEFSRITDMLSSCPNLESLKIGYDHRRGAGYMNPTIDDFLICSRWQRLTSLTLTNVRCSPTGMGAAAAFLGAHPNLEVLHLELGATQGRPFLVLPANSLPRLHELRSTKDIVTAVLRCPSDAPRPLEMIKGVSLSGASCDGEFFASLKMCGSTIKRIELAGWNEMEDVRRLVECVPKLTWLDVGKRVTGSTVGSSSAISGNRVVPLVHANVVEWATILDALPDLTTFHGVRLFYEVTPAELSVSVSDRSKVRKNDEIASVLAWKCPKLRRLDHWEEGSGKVIVLLRGNERIKFGDKVKYEVRRVGR